MLKIWWNLHFFWFLNVENFSKMRICFSRLNQPRVEGDKQTQNGRFLLYNYKWFTDKKYSIQFLILILLEREVEKIFMNQNYLYFSRAWFIVFRYQIQICFEIINWALFILFVFTAIWTIAFPQKKSCHTLGQTETRGLVRTEALCSSGIPGHIKR